MIDGGFLIPRACLLGTWREREVYMRTLAFVLLRVLLQRASDELELELELD